MTDIQNIHNARSQNIRKNLDRLIDNAPNKASTHIFATDYDALIDAIVDTYSHNKRAQVKATVRDEGLTYRGVKLLPLPTNPRALKT